MLVETTLKNYCKALIRKHGSVRDAAAWVGLDHAYLHRMAKGHATEPSDEVIKKLGLKRVRTTEYFVV